MKTGAFVFIFIERTGFVGVNDRGLKSDTNVFTVQAGQPVEDLLFRMLPTAVLSGRITDEDGDPMFGVRILALRKRPGKATRETAGSEATNDLGEYRLPGLFPGQYWIAAMPPPDIAAFTRANPPGRVMSRRVLADRLVLKDDYGAAVRGGGQRCTHTTTWIAGALRIPKFLAQVISGRAR